MKQMALVCAFALALLCLPSAAAAPLDDVPSLPPVTFPRTGNEQVDRAISGLEEHLNDARPSEVPTSGDCLSYYWGENNNFPSEAADVDAWEDEDGNTIIRIVHGPLVSVYTFYDDCWSAGSNPGL